MAEPVIISYARGLLKEFPGVPEGTIDVIPVDLVVAAIIDAAAGPDPRRARHHPGGVGLGQPAAVPPPRRHGADVLHRAPDLRRRGPADHRARVVLPRPRPRAAPARAGQVGRSTKGEKVLQALPLRGKQAAWAATLEEKKEEVERALAYVELYGAYAECEAIYGVDRLLARWDRLDPEDQATFCFDPRVVDWSHYAPNVHLPSVVDHARVRTTPGGRVGEKREDRLRRQVLAPERHLAAFDLENTLIASNVVASYSWLATRRLPREDRLRFVLQTLREAPAPARRRPQATAATSCATSTAATKAPTSPSSRPTPSRCSATSSSPSPSRPPSAGCASTAASATAPCSSPARSTSPSSRCARCSTTSSARRSPRRPDGTYRGELTDVPPTGEARAQALLDYAAEHGFDLAESVAYADSTSDLPMLEAVGFPVAVNPETRLAALARKRGWLVEHFDKASGASPRSCRSAPSGAAPAAAESRRSRMTTVDATSHELGGGAMKALVFSRKPAKFAAAMLAGRLSPGAGAKVGPLALRDVDPPELPGPGWVRVRPRLAGICGSRPGHHRRHLVALVRADRVVPVHARPRGRGRPRRRPRVSSSSPCSAAWPAASARRARPAPRAASTTASGSATATSSRACSAASASPPAAAGPR